MIGDAGARGPRKSTTAAGPEFVKKNSQGKSFKTIAGKPKSDGGGDEENAAVSKRSTKGMRPGPGVSAPAEMWDSVKNMRNGMGKGKSFKTSYPKENTSDAGSRIDEWCNGKRGSYK
jgi:hypothetical protein